MAGTKLATRLGSWTPLCSSPPVVSVEQNRLRNVPPPSISLAEPRNSSLMLEGSWQNIGTGEYRMLILAVETGQATDVAENLAGEVSDVQSRFPSACSELQCCDAVVHGKT